MTPVYNQKLLKSQKCSITRSVELACRNGRQLRFFENRIVVVGGPFLQKGFLNVEDVCSLLGKGKSTVRRWARSSKIRAYRPGGRDWLFAVHDVEAFIRAQQWSHSAHENP